MYADNILLEMSSRDNIDNHNEEEYSEHKL